MVDYFVNSCDYTEDEAKDIVNGLLTESYYEESGKEYDVQAVYRLEIVNV